MAESNVAKYLETCDSHYLYQCTREELCEIAGSYQIILKGKLKDDMQKELLEKLGEKEVYSTVREGATASMQEC